MDADDRLRLDYEQTTQLMRTLIDVRFKLLAFVPTISAAAVGFLGRPRPGAELLAIGLLGLVATLGIFVYELRNSQLFDALVHRAQELEERLSLPSTLGASGPGGLLRERPGRSVRLLGTLAVWHDRGLALVYGAALAGWSYLVGWGVLRALGIGNGARWAGVVIGVIVGVVVILEVERIEQRPDKAGARPPDESVRSPATG